MTAALIDHISITGFKSIASIDALALSPVNLIIGANGSGKSNFIGAFLFLHEVREGRLQDYVRRSGGADQVLHFGSKTTPQAEFHISFEDERNQYHLRLQPAVDDSLYPTYEEVAFWDKFSGYKKPYDESLISREGGREAGISNPQATKTAGWVRSRLGSWRIFHVHDTSASSPLRKTSQVNDNSYLRPDGSNLASFLYFLNLEHFSSYDLIRKAVQRIAPYFDDFLLEPDRLNAETIRLAWKHKESSQYFSSSALSDGTIRFIVLATLFLQPQKLRPSVILVDEPELGLHPYAITLLASLIEQASLHTQIIVSTQSPLLLDHFAPEDVLVADRVGNATEISRLSSKDLAGWLAEYSLGQLWEKNELGGRPMRG